MSKALFNTELFINTTVEGLNKCLNVSNYIETRFNLNFDECFGLHTVLVESIENAFIHGNKGIKELKVRVLISVSRSEIFVEVEDCGEGYDFDSIPSPIEAANIHNEAGRGIYFIKSLCSSCYTIGRGNIIRIIIKR